MVVSWMLQVVAVVSGQSEYTEAVEGWLSGTRDHGEGPGGGGGAEATAATGEASLSAPPRL